jgi:hypothetical protein
MGSSFNLKYVRERWGPDEASALKSMANSEGCYRIYKYGDQGWESYKPIHYPEEERSTRSSPYIHYCVLVYDKGKVINIDGLWEKSPLKKKGILSKLFW